MQTAAARKRETRTAVVLPFPAQGREAPAEDAKANAAALPAAPRAGARPTLLPPAWRERLRAALFVSIALHVAVFLFFQLRFDDELERAAGAAASLSEGAVVLPVDIVDAALPPAPAPADASRTGAELPAPAASEAESNTPTQPSPEPKLAEILHRMPPPPEPAPVRLPAPVQAETAPLPDEVTAAFRAAETPPTPEAPAVEFDMDATPPMPRARPPEAAETTVERREARAAHGSVRTAASPSRAAAARSAGDAGAGGAAEFGARAAIASYQARVFAHLSRHRLYPPEARSRGITGLVRVRFALARDGRVISAALAGESGAAILDEAALDMVRRASPFPRFPPELATARMEFAAPIRFDLR